MTGSDNIVVVVEGESEAVGEPCGLEVVAELGNGPPTVGETAFDVGSGG